MMPENWNSGTRSVLRLKLSKHVPMATNACAAIEELLDAEAGLSLQGKGVGY